MLQKGQSVLYHACYFGHAQIVLLLLRHHAAVDLPNDVRYSNTMYTSLIIIVQNSLLRVSIVRLHRIGSPITSGATDPV